MLSYCLKYRKNTESKNPKILKTKNEKIMVFPNREVCRSKKLRFIKENKIASGILSSLGLGTNLSKILFLGPVLF